MASVLSRSGARTPRSEQGEGEGDAPMVRRDPYHGGRKCHRPPPEGAGLAPKTMILLLLLALLLGVAVTTQGLVNGELARRVPLAAAILVNALVTCSAAALWWLFAPGPTRRLLPGGESPWWLYTGGLLGLLIITAAAWCFPRLGAGPTIALAVAAQLGAALAFDHYGLGGEPLPMTPARLLGAALLLAGALLVLWPRLALRK
jgi:transporter family-2 protein